MKKLNRRQKAMITQAFFSTEGETGLQTGAAQPIPFVNQEGIPGLYGPQAETPATPANTQKPTLGSIFEIIDKMGGVDGIIGTFGKIQKMMGMFRQIQPVLKVIGSFAGSKAATKGASMRQSRSRTGISGNKRSLKTTMRNTRR
jgi:hypothetical protein